MKSELIKKGVEKAPHRSLMNALGLAKWEKDRPFIGIINSQNDLVPGHLHLDEIAKAVKAGVWANGGTPFEFPAIAVCDGIAMNHEGMHYSLASRELIADSIEVMALAHALDALVLIANCDKVVPGMLMAAARLNLPAVLLSGGPMQAGRFQGRNVSLSTIFEGVGAVQAGKMTSEEMEELENAACPGSWARCSNNHTGFTCSASITISCMGSSLLMPHQYMLQGRVIQLIIERYNSSPRIAKNNLNPFLFQRFDNNFCTCYHGFFLLPLYSCLSTAPLLAELTS
jgi:dihydroxy-acid dehydratase